ncbi:Tetratricopeptide repeat-containing protein [Muriicola jejuensis]|uniref:Tetratricopeptide repeat protein n=1 Tax=Muriicola jejuensis TaxID=504488 RepID=A0A6P0U8H8_9FLAO|nr:tetratricopeptide repeat protein [Muriicola jejuensis]NER09465.1 tetratricopeptide repeat protein [Muriicola jejuensis]SMP08400.1 Tetratricopeptide repeat-containing protein [Muriicola jejuensis]
MMTVTFKDRIRNAEAYLRTDRLEDSISEYTMALEQATGLRQQIDLHMVLGRLYQRSKQPANAITQFETALQLLQKGRSKEDKADMAAAHNNLAALYLQLEIPKAISHYREALEDYGTLVKEKGQTFLPHLANTHFALAEAYVQDGKPLKAKTHIKDAIRIYENLPGPSAMRARAHYQLGLIYTDEFNLHDAQLQYNKALKVYQSMPEADESSVQAIMAALHNNLGVTYHSMEEAEKAVEAYHRSLDHYRKLAETHADIFLPYEASTLNSLAIVYNTMKESQRAIEMVRDSIAIYHRLTEEYPDQYTHYLATSLHNLGLLYFEDKDLDNALHYFTEALAIRRNLMRRELEQFGPDTCATALNLVELYQIQLESTLDLSYRQKSLELLMEVRDLLDSVSDDRLVLRNMRADCASHLEYFNNVDMEELTLRYVKVESDSLREEIHGTIEPSEKRIYQEALIKLLEEKYELYPGNEEFRKALALAHNDMAWYLLRLERAGESRKHIERGLELDAGLNLLWCNKAHCELLENNMDLALSFYAGFLGSQPENPLELKKVLMDDLEILSRTGVKKESIAQIKKFYLFDY